MDQTSLNPKDISGTTILRLIEQFSKSGVSSFKGLGLEVSFFPRSVAETPLREPLKEDIPLPEDDISETAEPDIMSGAMAEEIRRDTLMIEDPLAYEQLLMDELNKETSGG